MNLGSPIVDRLIDMEINKSLTIDNYIIKDNITRCSQHLSDEYINLIIRRFKAIATFFNINIDSFAFATGIKLYSCKRDDLIIIENGIPIIKIKDFYSILDKTEFSIFLQNLRYYELRKYQMYDKPFPIDKIDNFFCDLACRNIKYQYDMVSEIMELLNTHKLEVNNKYTTRGNQLKHVFQNWHNTTIKQKQYTEGLVLMDIIIDIYDRKTPIEKPIITNNMAFKLHECLIHMCKTIKDNVLLNSLFYTENENRPIEQFIIYLGRNVKNNTITYCISNSSFVGVSFSKEKGKDKLIATSCLRVEFNKKYKTYHFYPYINILPSGYKKYTQCIYSYYQETITQDNFNKIIRNDVVNKNDALIILIIRDAFKYAINKR